MATNVYMKSIVLGTEDYVKLADVPTVVNATVFVTSDPFQPLTSTVVNVRFRGGPPVPWRLGATVRFDGVDLFELDVQGGEGLEVLVVGYTR